MRELEGPRVGECWNCGKAILIPKDGLAVHVEEPEDDHPIAFPIGLEVKCNFEGCEIWYDELDKDFCDIHSGPAKERSET